MIGALLLLAAAADPNQTHGPINLTEPVTWFSAEDYPATALRAGEQGTVKFVLDISDTGMVEHCRIVESSGFADLDAVTCAMVTQRARFKPATDDNGKPVASTFSHRTAWRLPTARPDSDVNNPAEQRFGGANGATNKLGGLVDIKVDATGRVLSCAPVREPNPAIDTCLAFPVGKVVISPPLVEGKPVAATVSVLMMVNVKADSAP